MDARADMMIGTLLLLHFKLLYLCMVGMRIILATWWMCSVAFITSNWRTSAVTFAVVVSYTHRRLTYGVVLVDDSNKLVYARPERWNTSYQLKSVVMMSHRL